MADLFDIMKAKGLEVPKSVEKTEKKKTPSNGEGKNEEKTTSKEKVIELYSLPLTLYYAGSEHRIEAEEYPGVSTLTKIQLLTHIQTVFGFRVLTDKRTSFEYEKETNEIIVHLKNPSKGNSFGLKRSKFNDGTTRFVRTDGYGMIVGPNEEMHNEESSLIANPGIHLTTKVPMNFLYEILETFLKVYPLEHLAQIYYNRKSNEYHLHFPEQDTTTDRIKRECCSFFLNDKDCVLFSEVHSHGDYPAVFSGTDNVNEVDFLIYGVIGGFGSKPTWLFRLGYGGFFQEVDVQDIFDFANGEA